MSNLKTIFNTALSVLRVPEAINGSDWMDEHYMLPAESSNTSGPWVSTGPQKAFINACCNDAIEKVDLFKSARWGGTKAIIGIAAYFLAHKSRNVGMYQPTAGNSDSFAKTEIAPAIRECKPWYKRLVSKSEKSSLNTLDLKVFEGCYLYLLGGHSAENYRRITLDVVIADELSGFPANAGGAGDPTTQMWGRVKNATYKKQIQISTPTLTGFCLIEKSAKAAEDVLFFQAECPRCRGHAPIHWGGKDVPYGFKWTDRDAKTVMHVCSLCAEPWPNGDLETAVANGFWRGENGWETVDGIDWKKDGEHSYPPRHIAFRTWAGYSPFSSWSQIVEEWYDAFGDFAKMQTFTNTTLGQTWAIDKDGTITAEVIDGMIPIDDLSSVVAVTVGVDTQDDRLELVYIGHEHFGGIVVLDYAIYRGDMSQPDVWKAMAQDVFDAKFACGVRQLPVIAAGIDTQGHHTTNVHRFLQANRKGNVFFGINGAAHVTFEIADKPGKSKGIKDGVFYTIGVNVIKQKLFTAIRNYDQERGAFKIYSGANLPPDFSKQLTAEKMEISRSGGLDRVVYTNKGQKRNEALDTIVYAIAAKAFIKKHRGSQGRKLIIE